MNFTNNFKLHPIPVTFALQFAESATVMANLNDFKPCIASHEEILNDFKKHDGDFSKFLRKSTDKTNSKILWQTVDWLFGIAATLKILYPFAVSFTFPKRLSPSN